MVAGLRIFGRAPNKEPISPCNKCSCSRCCALWGQVCDLPPKRLALATNSLLEKTMKYQIQTAAIQKTVPLILAGLLASGIGFDAKALDIRGGMSCGVWAKDIGSNDAMPILMRSWLLAFMSGMAYATDTDVLKGTDNESVYLWMTNYCQKNPLNRVYEGAVSLFLELKKKKNL